jgi:hypothetical protein
MLRQLEICSKKKTILLMKLSKRIFATFQNSLKQEENFAEETFKKNCSDISKFAQARRRCR